VRFRGITLNVPATWTDVGFARCLELGGYVETITSPPPTGVYHCPAIRVGAYRKLNLRDSRFGGLGVTTPVTATQLAGMAATVQRVNVLTSGVAVGGYAEDAHAAATRTDVSVVAPTPADAEAILATARTAGT
jgi:hypothetical protein